MVSLRPLLLLSFLVIQALNATTPLKVALYPYLPDSYGDDYQSLESRIKEDFEARYPAVDLQLRPLSTPGNFYNYKELLELLHTHDVVEVDSIFLGDLIHEEGLLAPWPEQPCEQNSWQPMPQKACANGCDENEDCYAYPHWQCAYFLFAEANKLSEIDDLGSFLAALEESLTVGAQLPLAFILSGSHTVAEIFMDAWSDAGTSTAPWENRLFNQAVVTQALENLSSLCAYACTPNGKEPARDGFFGTYSMLPQKSYDAGLSDYYIGYSEDYYYLLAEHSDLKNTSAIHAPWGAYTHPNIAVDALLLASHTSKEKQYYAQKFAEYMTTPSTFEWIVLSQDRPGAKVIPRYLLPATYSAFNKSRIGNNKMMQNYLKILNSPDTSLLPTHLYSDLVYTIANRTNAFLDQKVKCKTP